MSQSQAISIQPHTDIVWAVVVPRDLDDAVTAQVQQSVIAAAADRPGVLDLSNVEFVPSVALGAFVGLTRRLKHDGQRFILVGLHPQVRTTLAITRLDKLFEIFPRCEDVLKQLGSGPAQP